MGKRPTERRAGSSASLLVPIVQTTYDPNKELVELLGVSLRRPLPLWEGGPGCQLAYQRGADARLSHWSRPSASSSSRPSASSTSRLTAVQVALVDCLQFKVPPIKVYGPHQPARSDPSFNHYSIQPLLPHRTTCPKYWKYWKICWSPYNRVSVHGK